MEQNIKSMQDNLTNCFYDKSIQNAFFVMSHMIFSVTSVFFLKKYDPILLSIILSIILSFISYTEKKIIPMPLLFLMGFTLYFMDIFIVDFNNFDNVDDKLKSIKKTIWKIPFYGILIYYIKLILFLLCTK